MCKELSLYSRFFPFIIIIQWRELKLMKENTHKEKMVKRRRKKGEEKREKVERRRRDERRIGWKE